MHCKVQIWHDEYPTELFTKFLIFPALFVLIDQFTNAFKCDAYPCSKRLFVTT